MKSYILVDLNKGLNISAEKELKNAQNVIDEYVCKGWELQQIVSPSDGSGRLIGLFYID